MTATFKRQVHNGIIELPDLFREQFEGEVTITLHKEDESRLTKGEGTGSKMLSLIRNPVRVAGFTPLSREESNERQR